MEGEVLAHKYSQADCACQSQPLVVRVPNSNRKSISLITVLQIEDTERLHGVRRDGKLLIDHTDVAVT
jgi:hypothetical protein